jgi:outer membrane porin, OprD family
LAYTRNAEGDNLRRPWSSYPGYTSAQVTFFDQAGESAFSAKLSYDFKGVGLAGVTAYALFAHGWGRVNPSTKQAVPDANEFNIDVQWRPTWRFLQGLWLRTRYGMVQQYGGSGNDLHDLCVILHYNVPLL